MIMQYPEHEKMKAVKDRKDILSDFLEWAEMEGIEFIKTKGKYKDTEIPISANVKPERLLAMYFGIDLKKLENEKRQMLKALQRMNQD